MSSETGVQLRAAVHCCSLLFTAAVHNIGLKPNCDKCSSSLASPVRPVKTWGLAGPGGCYQSVGEREREREVTAGGWWALTVSTAHISVCPHYWALDSGLWALKVRVNIDWQNFHSLERNKPPHTLSLSLSLLFHLKCRKS